jgi:hypothetical protein
VSSLGTVSLEELRKAHDTPQVYQFSFHKDRGLNRAMLQRAKEARVDIMMLTVDSITGGNRERDLRTGFSIPFRLTLAGTLQFAIKPIWGINYATHERFKLPQLDEHVDMSGGALSIGRYFTEMLDPSMKMGNFLGLPVNFPVFSIITVIVTAGTLSVFGQAIMDPVLIVEKDRQSVHRRRRVDHVHRSDHGHQHRSQFRLASLRHLEPQPRAH